MTGSARKAATPTSTAVIAAAASATLLLVVVLVCCGNPSGSGSGKREEPYQPSPRWNHVGGSDRRGGGGVSPPAGQRAHLERTDEPRPGASVAAASAAAATSWMPRYDGEGLDVLLHGPATRSGPVGGGTLSVKAEARSRRRWDLLSESESGKSSALHGAAPDNTSRVPHDALAKEPRAGWAERMEESVEEWRGKGTQAELGGLRDGGDFRLRGAVFGEDRADGEQGGARDTAAVVAEEEGAIHDGGVLRAGPGRSLSNTKFSHAPDRCFVAKGEERTRCHANIFLFGVSKCGTTSLAHWMGEHPELRWVTNPDKRDKPGSEAHVIETVAKNDHASAYALTAPEAQETDPVIDYTPHYSILADVPYKIVHLYGKQAYDGTLKYVVLLREPVARTISSWQFKFDLHGVEKGKAQDSPSSERRTLEWVFAEGKERVNVLVACRSKHLKPGSLFDSKLRKADVDTCNPKRFLESNDYFSHVGKSVYVLQLERWINLFGQENVKVLFLEEMALEPVETLSSVFEFLGMDLLDEEGAEEPKGLPARWEWEGIVRRSHNLTDEKKKKLLDPQATPELVQSMRDYFAPFNEQLQELLGRPLPENWSLPSGSRV